MTAPPTWTFRHGLALGAALVLLASTGLLLARRDPRLPQARARPSGQGSGIAASQTRHVAGFSGVELAGSNVVTVRVGATQSVVVHADDNLFSRVTTQVRAGSLVIGNTPGNLRSRTPMSVAVTVPSLESLCAQRQRRPRRRRSRHAGADGNPVRVAASSSKRDRREARHHAGGSGDAQLDQLVARDVHAAVRGSGRILVAATASLDASVPGSGAIIYSGNPTDVTTSVTGSGAVVRG